MTNGRKVGIIAINIRLGKHIFAFFGKFVWFRYSLTDGYKLILYINGLKGEGQQIMLFGNFVSFTDKKWSTRKHKNIFAILCLLSLTTLILNYAKCTAVFEKIEFKIKYFAVSLVLKYSYFVL